MLKFTQTLVHQNRHTYAGTYPYNYLTPNFVYHYIREFDVKSVWEKRQQSLLAIEVLTDSLISN